jgi:hypothetical protein
MTMSVEENRALVRRFYEEIDKGNSSVIDDALPRTEPGSSGR